MPSNFRSSFVRNTNPRALDLRSQGARDV
jgi:hypothetical protein